MPTENVLVTLTMHIKMYALGVTCSTSPLFNFDVFIFAEVIQKQGDWQARFRLNDGKELFKPGGNIRNNKQTYLSYVSSDHVQCVVYICFSQTASNSWSRSERIPNRITIGLFVDHFNKTILHILSNETCQWTVIHVLVELKVMCKVVTFSSGS